MKILIAPLNWGLGHATRCAALVRQYMNEGHEVVVGGDGAGLTWLKRYFPTLRYVELAPLELTYGKGKSQVCAMLRALPKLIRWSWEDAARLNQILSLEPFDLIISDNRFGLYTPRVRCVYMTHQLWIRLPRFWRWLEPLTARLHARIYNKFNEVWVPDYERLTVDNAQCTVDGLSGILGHPQFVQRNPELRAKVRYIGPLSRFTDFNCSSSKLAIHLLPECPVAPDSPIHRFTDSPYHIVALLSGLEPQRTLLEQQIMSDYADRAEQVLIVRGLVQEPFTTLQRGSITLVPWLGDAELVSALQGADKIICRSGYSTIMDLEKLGLLAKAEFIPTPGQPEQEYLAEYFKQF